MRFFLTSSATRLSCSSRCNCFSVWWTLWLRRRAEQRRCGAELSGAGRQEQTLGESRAQERREEWDEELSPPSAIRSHSNLWWFLKSINFQIKQKLYSNNIIHVSKFNPLMLQAVSCRCTQNINKFYKDKCKVTVKGSWAVQFLCTFTVVPQHFVYTVIVQWDLTKNCPRKTFTIAVNCHHWEIFWTFRE